MQSFDVSTNRYYYTQSETIPLQSAYAKLGLQLKLRPDIKHAEEFIAFTVGTTTHKYIMSWKQRLRGTIITI